MNVSQVTQVKFSQEIQNFPTTPIIKFTIQSPDCALILDNM